MLLVMLGISVLLFGFGFYLGNQIGRTAHIRAHLREARTERISLP